MQSVNNVGLCTGTFCKSSNCDRMYQRELPLASQLAKWQQNIPNHSSFCNVTQSSEDEKLLLTEWGNKQLVKARLTCSYPLNACALSDRQEQRGPVVAAALSHYLLEQFPGIWFCLLHWAAGLAVLLQVSKSKVPPVPLRNHDMEEQTQSADQRNTPNIQRGWGRDMHRGTETVIDFSLSCLRSMEHWTPCSNYPGFKWWSSTCCAVFNIND